VLETVASKLTRSLPAATATVPTYADGNFGRAEPDGRTLHWQGMIWDHASNWDEEDMRAIVAYLRVLPPIVCQIPPARAPAAEDCAIYTFWIAVRFLTPLTHRELRGRAASWVMAGTLFGPQSE